MVADPEEYGATPATPGVAEGLVCSECDGDGVLDAQTPFGLQPVFCPECDGRGGSCAEAVVLARAFNEGYRHDLLDLD